MSTLLRVSSWCAVLVLLLNAGPLHAQTVTIAWDPNTESNLAGYQVGYGRAPGMDEHLVSVGFATQWTVSGLISSQRYYFRVYALSQDGMRSAPSVEVSTLIEGSSGGGSTGGCSTPDPFVSLGGGTCVNGGWLPPSMPSPAPAPAPAPAPPPPPAPSTRGCAGTDPFVVLGGGTCFNGAWLPPGMAIPGTFVPSPAPLPPPPTGLTGCATPDPFVSLGGGTCHNGGWLPPGMAIPGGGTSSSFALSASAHATSTPATLTANSDSSTGPAPATQTALAPAASTSSAIIATSPGAKPSETTRAKAASASAPIKTAATACPGADPYAGLPGMIGECVDGRWVSIPGVRTAGTVYSFNTGDAFWGILGDDGRIYRPTGGLPANLQQVRTRVTFEGRFVGEVAVPDRIVLIDLRTVNAR